jgi:hypothetical protein
LKIIFQFFEDNNLAVDITPLQAAISIYRNVRKTVLRLEVERQNPSQLRTHGEGPTPRGLTIASLLRRLGVHRRRRRRRP